MVTTILVSALILGATPGAGSTGAASVSDPKVAALLRAEGTDGDEQRASLVWSGGAAAWSATALALADAGMLFAGGLLVGHIRGDCAPGRVICLSPTAIGVAVAGLVLVPPTLAIVAADQIHGARSTARIALASAAQGAAVTLLLAAVATSSQPGRTALLASAAALHFVGIPLTLGLAPARGASGGEDLRGAPTLSLSLRW